VASKVGAGYKGHRHHPSDYINEWHNGRAEFDYSNNNGEYTIGPPGEYQFTTKWTSASSDSIHVYNDPDNVECVALADDVNEIGAVDDANKYNSSSRSRTPQEGQVVVMRNCAQKYAAIKIVDIKNLHHGDKRDWLVFDYVIQDSPHFTMS